MTIYTPPNFGGARKFNPYHRTMEALEAVLRSKTLEQIERLEHRVNRYVPQP